MSAELEPVAFEHDGRVVTDSRHVAEMFDKEHKNVLRAIDGLISEAEQLGRDRP